jgi:protein involved in polysaccharide export with SLBB domain
MLLNQMNGRGLDVAIDSDEYMVGPGDEFTISFISDEIDDIVSRIGPGGKLFLKSVGAVELTGLSLRDAIQKIEESVRNNFSGAGYDIQLSDYRFIRINVIGEVVQPGLYYVPAVWRVSEVIDLAGGLTPAASTRRIELRSPDSKTQVDLVRFEKIGDTRSNPFIGNGRTIFVPGRQNAGQYVAVSGEVVRPGIFETVAGDRLSDYLAYASGLNGDLADMTIEIASSNDGNTRRIDGADAEALDYIPQPGENITVTRKDGRSHSGNVIITGEVIRSGVYPVSGKDFSLGKLLKLCGGITPQGCANMIRIYRWTNYRVMPERIQESESAGSRLQTQFYNSGDSINRRALVSFNPRQPLDPNQIMLVDGDSVYVPKSTGMISVSGAVVSPGLVAFHAGKGVGYYLEQAGGLGFNADRENMVVYNPVTGGGISADKAGELYDGEMLFVPQKESGTKP